jgi:hypothetical protein
MSEVSKSSRVASTSALSLLTSNSQPKNRHNLTALDVHRQQLAKLITDGEKGKEVFIPAPPKEKRLRDPREMMRNVQGSSAGAGSGEFHVSRTGCFRRGWDAEKSRFVGL